MLLSEVMELISMGLCPHSVENGISKMLSVFPHNSFSKESACNAGDPGSIPGSGRSPGEEICQKIETQFCLPVGWAFF